MNKIVAILIMLVPVMMMAGIRAVTPVMWQGGTNSVSYRSFSKQCEFVNKENYDIAFIGDTATWQFGIPGKVIWKRYFSGTPYRAVNLGINGDRTENVLWRIRNGAFGTNVLQGVVVSAGASNIGSDIRTSDNLIDTFLGIRAIVDAVREAQTNAVIVLMSIPPFRRNPDDPLRCRCNAVNAELAKLADGKSVFWCDLTTDLLTQDGVLPEGVVPAKNYEYPVPRFFYVWAESVKPYLNWALSDRSMPPPPNKFTSYAIGDRELTNSPVLKPVSVINADSWAMRPWWEARLAEKRGEACDVRDFDLVMLGDSITHTWDWESRSGKYHVALTNEFKVLNFGFSGDRVEHLMWRLENGGIDGITAKVFTLMIGTNNYLDRPEDVADGIRHVLDWLSAKHPESKVILHAVFPRGNSPKDSQRIRNDKVNDIIREYADGERVIWFDPTEKFLDDKGDVVTYFKDRLHPWTEGFRVWYESLVPVLRGMVPGHTAEE